MGDNLYYYDNDRNWNDGYTHHPNIGVSTTTFTVEDYEVFQVIKR